MKQYVGKLHAHAEPMTRHAYNDFRGWALPADEDGSDSGYRVVNTLSGHVSWLPSSVFHSIYKESE